VSAAVAPSAEEVYGRALAEQETGVRARFGDGTMQPLEVERWLGPATWEEREALDLVGGPVLDVGCGPGRHVVELQRRGIVALGIDTAPAAVEIASRRGAAVLRRSVFARLPGEGRWGGVLLLDGNVGIGGDAPALLRRVAQLLRPDGRVVVELDPPHLEGRVTDVRMEGAAGLSEPFRWGRLGVAEAEPVAREAGFRLRDRWEAAGRGFCCLERA
jgi:SAM-dependent methyltransferase